jgi:hypothetical protein
MSNYRWLLAFMFAVVFTPGSLLAQQAATVTGRVTSETGAAIAAATVRIPTLGVATQSDNNGTYRLTVPAARVRAGQQVQVTASRIGLATQSRSVTLTPGATLTAWG